ncbi:hypothetical protein GF412_04280 [Candidatus Micrarchaeota archaeon]|nr:hypothetical protein [Candidatus Micrarchaeota archaeon]
MQPRAIVKTERQARRAQPRAKFARHTIRSKEGTIYDPELGVNVKVGPKEKVPARIALKIRSIFEGAKGMWELASEPPLTRTVETSHDELFAGPSVKVEKRAEP